MCFLVQSVNGLHLGGQEKHRQGNIRLMVSFRMCGGGERWCFTCIRTCLQQFSSVAGAGEVRGGERGEGGRFICIQPCIQQSSSVAGAGEVRGGEVRGVKEAGLYVSSPVCIRTGQMKRVARHTSRTDRPHSHSLRGEVQCSAIIHIIRAR
jgi:hypothetical protein